VNWKAIAIDGPGGSGKSTLAKQLAKDFDAAIIPMDAFLLPVEKHRFSAIAKNYDLDRFFNEVVLALGSDSPVSYSSQNLETGELKKIKIPAGKKVIVEGIYSFEVDFREIYDFAIFVDAPREELLRRGMPSGKSGSSWLDKWLVGEETYLEAQSPRLAATLIIDGSKPFPASQQLIELSKRRKTERLA